MLYVALIGGLLFALAWKLGLLRTVDRGDVAAIAGVLLGFRLLTTGHGFLAIACFAGVAGWAAYRSQQLRRARMPVAEARALLGVAEDADQEAIRAAHKKLIARVHPDAGGTPELARQVNAAREILLSEARNRVPVRRE
ncbi:MAG: DnaJ domain-containing protein [Parasphingopyxis sp.]|nr:DnaJ domain-containing protein [Sphingomonadales bacterium]